MLECIRLRNFKAFDDFELGLGALTLLSGLNSSGKSSVIQALGLLRQSYDANLLTAGKLMINGDLVKIGTGRDILYHNFESEAYISISLEGHHNGTPFDLSWTADVPMDADVLICTEFPDSICNPLPNLFDKGFQFLLADRITPSVTLPKSHHAVRQRRFLGAHGEFTAHFLQEFGDEFLISEQIRFQGESGTTLSAHLNAWLQEFGPGMRVIAENVEMTDLVRLAFSYKSKGAGYSDSLRPTNVGFGLTHVLPVLTACLAAPPGTLLVVENPESQLHPHGQATIGRLLALTAAGGVQVVVESHSDHVLNGIRLAVKEGQLPPSKTRLHFFSRPMGEASRCETPDLRADGRLSYWPSGFFDQWEKSLDQLLD